VIGVLYGSLLAWAQRDFKKLVAYSSVAHLGFVVVGTFAFSSTALQGAVLQGVNHGITTGALFLLVGVLYDRLHTRQFKDFGGLRLPTLYRRPSDPETVTELVQLEVNPVLKGDRFVFPPSIR